MMMLMGLRDSVTNVLALLLLLGLHSVSSTDGIGNILSASGQLHLTSNQTLVSTNNVFELGFFSLQHRWYVGMWYKNIPVRTYVWVANRDGPLNDSRGTFGIFDGDLRLQDEYGQIFWSATTTRSGSSLVLAELLGDGNLVLRYSHQKDPQDFLWQSFDNPTDTLLPGMKLGIDSQVHTQRLLTSWSSGDDPATGQFRFRLDTQGSPELSLIFKGARVFRSGPWNGDKFIRLPRVFNLSRNMEESSCVFTPSNMASYSRLVMAHSGIAILYTWNEMATKWNLIWNSISDMCDLYNHCGSNAYCDMNLPMPSMCACIQGFESSGVNMSNGCVRKTPLVCGGNKFSKLVNMTFPHALAPISHDWINKEEECRKMCISDCNCTAYSLTNSLQVSRASCVIWREDLVDLRRYSVDGLDLYVKIDGIDKQKRLSGVELAFIISGAILGAITLLFSGLWLWRRITAGATHTQIEMVDVRGDNLGLGSTADPSIPRIEYREIVEATNNFADQIGEGGFGKVFRGRLANGLEIAVKKLSEISRQGADEFDNEVRSIARLQHVNIVRLYGCCDQNAQKLLVYEYLANGSLETHLFGANDLDWPSRFKIIKGIARGLTYMEYGWRALIVHRDLKPANILLDADMTPKISDFGLARMCVRSQNESFTEHTAGTRSYMSPEYLINGIFSAKSDIYSFGVTVLEIVSGTKHKRLSDILMLAWNKNLEDRLDEFVDETIRQGSLPWEEVKRSIQVSLLCVQSNPENRPKMSTVLAFLEDENIPIPQSARPDFTVSIPQGDIPSTSDSATTVNLFTVSEIQPL